MSKLRSMLTGLDHPLMFVVFLGMALYGLKNIAVWGADKANLPGLRATIHG